MNDYENIVANLEEEDNELERYKLKGEKFLMDQEEGVDMDDSGLSDDEDNDDLDSMKSKKTQGPMDERDLEKKKLEEMLAAYDDDEMDSLIKRNRNKR